MLSDILAKLLSVAINNIISTYAFPNDAKIASVVPIDKKTNDKYVIPNFRPVSIKLLLKSLWKYYQKGIIKIYECLPISFYISISKELQYPTCLVHATWKMERTFKQQLNSRENINGSFKGIWLCSTWSLTC